MVSKGLVRVVVCAWVVAVFAGAARAAAVTVGTGTSTSTVFLEFSDGNLFEFAVSYTDTGSVTGEDLLGIMRAERQQDGTAARPDADEAVPV